MDGKDIRGALQKEPPPKTKSPAEAGLVLLHLYRGRSQ